MSLYFEEKGCKIYRGDCKIEMAGLEESSVDLIVTDPPYGYSFMGKNWDKAVPKVEVWEECLRVLKPGAFCLVMSAPRQDVLSRMIVNLGDAGFRTDFTSIYWTYASGFPKAGNISKLVDKRNGAEREVIGKYVPPHRTKWGLSQDKDSVASNFSGKERTLDLTAPASKQAKALDGSYAGFQPKPAVEVVIVCMKPLSEKSYVDQAMKNGKGVAWFDSCRIPYNSDADLENSNGNFKPNRPYESEKSVYKLGTKVGVEQNTNGRFPANLLVSDDSLNDGNVRKSGLRLTHHKRSGAASIGTFKMRDRSGEPHKSGGDSGSYSRYFDLDAWYAQFLIVPKASKSEKNKGLEGFEEKDAGIGDNSPSGQSMQRLDGRKKMTAKNNHPTVKPVKLFCYLITMFSRAGDLILDPFVGSGTTLVSAKKTGRVVIGIDSDDQPGSCEIAAGRFKGIENELALEGS